MKRFLQDSDSTDLLLDAMCNIFGVVLIVAIAIGGVSISQKLSTPDKISRRTMQELQSKCSLQTTQLAAARSQRELLQELAKKIPATPRQESSYRDLIQLHSHWQEQVNDLADRIESADRQLAQAQALGERLNNSNEAQERQLIDHYNKALQQQSDSQILTYGKVQTSSLQPWRVLVDKEKFYIIGTNQDIYRRSSNDDQAVKISSFKQGRTRFFHISKRPEKGIDLREFSCRTTLPPPEKMKDHFVEIFSESDAVASAAFIIGKLRERKILIAWRTVPETGAVLRTAEQGIYEVSH